MISQRLSLNMPRLNQNQRIQALGLLVATTSPKSPTSVERWVVAETQLFGCASVSSKQVGWQIAIYPVDRGLQTVERTGSLYWRTFDVVFKRRQVLQGSTVSANRQYCTVSGKPGNPFGQGCPIWDKCLQHVIGLPVCIAHNGISVGGDSSGLGLYSPMSLGLPLVIMMVEFEFLEEEGNVLLIIVSLRETDLEVGVLWYGVALWAEENKSHCCARQPQCSRLH